MVRIHPHAAKRANQRGSAESEIIVVVENGEKFPAKYGRTGFRKNFKYGQKWLGKHYSTKQIEAYCVYEDNEWLVITVIVKYF